MHPKILNSGSDNLLWSPYECDRKLHLQNADFHLGIPRQAKEQYTWQGSFSTTIQVIEFLNTMYVQCCCSYGLKKYKEKLVTWRYVNALPIKKRCHQRIWFSEAGVFYQTWTSAQRSYSYVKLSLGSPSDFLFRAKLKLVNSSLADTCHHYTTRQAATRGLLRHHPATIITNEWAEEAA